MQTGILLRKAAAALEKDHALPTSQLQSDRLSQRTEGLRILLVEDDPDFQTLIYHLISSLGTHQLEWCDTGEAAIQLIQSRSLASNYHTNSFDLVLLDLNLPDMNGMQVMERLRLEPILRGIPFVFLTADSSLSTVQKAFELGAVEYITKPIRCIDLVARVHRWGREKLERQRARQQEQELARMQERLESTQRHLLSSAHSDAFGAPALIQAFAEHIGRESRRCRRESLPISLVAMDVHHESGQSVVESEHLVELFYGQIAPILRGSIFRAADQAGRLPDALCSLLLPGTTLTGAFHVAERLRQQITHLDLQSFSPSVSTGLTVSLGVSCLLPQESEPPEKLILRAMLALSAAKSSGGNHVKMFSAELPLDP